MAASMSPTPQVVITKVSGVAYAFAATGGNLAPSVNGATYTVPTGATSATTGSAKRPHLRLVR